MIETGAQRLAVQRDAALSGSRAGCLQQAGMAAKHHLDVGRLEALEDVADTVSNGRHSLTPSGVTTIGRSMRSGSSPELRMQAEHVARGATGGIVVDRDHHEAHPASAAGAGRCRFMTGISFSVWRSRRGGHRRRCRTPRGHPGSNSPPGSPFRPGLLHPGLIPSLAARPPSSLQHMPRPQSVQNENRCGSRRSLDGKANVP